MAKKGKSNVRQRKKTDEQSNDKEERDFLEEISKSTPKSKTKIFPLVGVGVLIVVLVFLATQSAPEKDASNPKTERSLKADTTTTSEDTSSTLAKYVTDYKVLQTLPHDTKSFTQGLTFRPDNSSIVYESTGMYNESVVQILDLKNNGQVLKKFDTPGQYFGEGVSHFRHNKDDHPGKLIHFTWREKTGFIMDLESLEILEQFNFTTTTTEGWGIIQDPNNLELIVSDGSTFLHFWDPHTFQESRPKVEVTYQTESMVQRGIARQSLRWINELEYDPQTNTVLANVYFQDIIARIDPTTGNVLTIYDLKSLYTDRLEGSDVFNGIALSAEGDLWVTGKYWPYLYQIELGES
jgi:glutaminyl-peptide cyclotransferase